MKLSKATPSPARPLSPVTDREEGGDAAASQRSVRGSFSPLTSVNGREPSLSSAPGPRALLPAKPSPASIGAVAGVNVLSVKDLSDLRLDADKVFTPEGRKNLLNGVAMPLPDNAGIVRPYRGGPADRVEVTGGQAWIDIMIDCQETRTVVQGVFGYPQLLEGDLKRLGRAGVLDPDFVESACKALSQSIADTSVRGVIPALSHAPSRDLIPSEVQAIQIKNLVRQQLYTRTSGNLLKSSNKISLGRHSQDGEVQRMMDANASLGRIRSEVHLTAAACMDAVWKASAANCLELAIACVKAAQQLRLDPDSVTVVRNSDHVIAIIGPAPHEKIPPCMDDWPDEWAVCDPWMNVACKKAEWPGRALLKLKDWSGDATRKMIASPTLPDRFVHASYPPLVHEILHSAWQVEPFEQLPGRARAAISLVGQITHHLSLPLPPCSLLPGLIQQARQHAPFMTPEQVQTILNSAATANIAGRQEARLIAQLRVALEPFRPARLRGSRLRRWLEGRPVS